MGDPGGAVGVGEEKNGKTGPPARVATPARILDGLKGRAPPKLEGLVNGPQRAWNTKGLSWRVSSDAAAAFSAGALVAPIITVIDRCVEDELQRSRRLAADKV